MGLGVERTETAGGPDALEAVDIVVGGDCEYGLGVGEDVRDLGVGELRVERHGGCTQVRDGQIHIEVHKAVPRHERDAIAWTDARRREAGGQPADPIGELSEGD